MLKSIMSVLLINMNYNTLYHQQKTYPFVLSKIVNYDTILNAYKL